MLRKYSYILFFCCIAVAGCLRNPGENAGGKASLTRAAVEGYLAEYNLNSPGVAVEIVRVLRAGGKYRERVTDQKGNKATLTAWIDENKQDIFCITFYRDEVCPECHGTGRRKLPKLLDMDTKISGVSISCLKCDGKGTLKNQFHKRCWVLSSQDYSDKAQAQERKQEYVLAGAPEGTDRYAKMLASSVPAERLEACRWLDRNYIREGMFFRDILPILDRARYSGNVEDKSLTTKILGSRSGDAGMKVYQFWAGRGDRKLYLMAYYRIYINNSTGKVVKTEFVSDKSALKRK